MLWQVYEWHHTVTITVTVNIITYHDSNNTETKLVIIYLYSLFVYQQQKWYAFKKYMHANSDKLKLGIRLETSL